MKHATNILLSVLVISFAGCHTLEVRRFTYSNGEHTKTIEDNDRKVLIANGEIVYYLPKTVLKVDIPIIIKTTTYREEGILRPDLEKEEAFAGPGIEISSKLEPDGRFPLRINAKKLLDAGWVDSNFKIGLNEKGLLRTMNSTSTDVTAKMIKNVVSTAVKAVEVAAVMYKDVLIASIDLTETKVLRSIAKLKRESERRKNIIKESIVKTLNDVNDVNDVNDPGELEKLYAKLKSLRGQLKAEVEAYMPEYKESTSTHTLYFEPNWVNVNGGIAMIRTIYLPNREEIEVILKLDKGENSIAGKPNKALDSAFAKKSLISKLLNINYVEDGLMYRVPVPFDVTVILDSNVEVLVLKDTITLTQFGPIAKIPVHWKFMGQCETSGVFDDATGVLKEFKIVTTDQSDDNYKDIQASLDNIKQLIEIQKKLSEVQPPAKDVKKEDK